MDELPPIKDLSLQTTTDEDESMPDAPQAVGLPAEDYSAAIAISDSSSELDEDEEPDEDTGNSSTVVTVAYKYYDLAQEASLHSDVQTRYIVVKIARGLTHVERYQLQSANIHVLERLSRCTYLCKYTGEHIGSVPMLPPNILIGRYTPEMKIGLLDCLTNLEEFGCPQPPVVVVTAHRDISSEGAEALTHQIEALSNGVLKCHRIGDRKIHVFFPDVRDVEVQMIVSEIPFTVTRLRGLGEIAKLEAVCHIDEVMHLIPTTLGGYLL